MQDEDLKRARKRSRRFSCSMVGVGVAFFVLIGAIVICSNQLAAVSSVTMDALPSETVFSGIPYPYPYANLIAYVARIDGHGVSVEYVGPYADLDDSLEFICRESALITQHPNDQTDNKDFLVHFRLINDCDRVVTVKVCWWVDSPFAPFFPPSCGI